MIKDDSFDDNFIKVYEFCGAPKYLQDLSTNGGDENWIAVVPAKILHTHSNYISFLNSTSFDSMGEPLEFDVFSEDNIKTHKIFIGCH